MGNPAVQESGLVFVEESHEYFLNGTKLPGVTTILEPLSNYGGIAQDVMDKAADRGTKVHKATELYDLGKLNMETLHPVLKPYLDAWILFRKETGFEPRSIEQAVYSTLYGYAGTLDRDGYFPDEPLCLLDIKARAQMTPDTGPQTAAYKNAFEDMTGEKVGKRYGVNLRPDGTYRLTTYKDKTDFKTFLSCLQIYNWRIKHGC